MVLQLASIIFSMHRPKDSKATRNRPMLANATTLSLSNLANCANDSKGLIKRLLARTAIALTDANPYSKVRRAEQVLARYSDYLEQEVNRRTAELAAANTCLERANQELRRLVNIDELTQVANRRFFEQQLRTEWQRLSREQQPLSLIIFDVDYFKRYNDRYGHQQGDDCLVRVAQAAKHAIRRPADFIARYGGEEFAIVLPNTSLQGATTIIKRIQDAIRLQAIPHEDSDVSEFITVSLGLASLTPSSTSSPTELVSLADKALYIAKSQNRNCFAINH